MHIINYSWIYSVNSEIPGENANRFIPSAYTNYVYHIFCFNENSAKTLNYKIGCQQYSDNKKIDKNLTIIRS